MSSLQQTGRFLPFGSNIQRKQLSSQGTTLYIHFLSRLLYLISYGMCQHLDFKTFFFCFFIVGGLPQSLSGSDTDVSTSNENLSNEERYVIRHTARQEPQGQENHPQSPPRSSSHKENIPNLQVHFFCFLHLTKFLINNFR